jgi:hypothetical protein
MGTVNLYQWQSDDDMYTGTGKEAKAHLTGNGNEKPKVERVKEQLDDLTFPP